MIVYNLLIQPLILVIDLLFVFLYDYFGKPAIAVIFLSIAVNLLALPLYRQADRIQKTERRQQEKMRPYVQHIKKTFSGDERYMMLSAYYKVEHYSPVSVLKESFPLLLQVPIFIAAYRYLSDAAVLSGASFGLIADLGKPDGLLRIGEISVNILPVLMTVLNLASGYVYAKKGTLREKVQIAAIALIFLILLYNSPAGLVLYWTTSQVFSLMKNLIMETDYFKKRSVLLAISISAIILSLICTLTGIALTSRFGMVVSEICLISSLVYLIYVALDLKGVKLPKLSKHLKLSGIEKTFPEVKYDRFITVGACLFLLFGLCIPSSVLSASASEYIETSTGSFQWFLLTYPFSVYAGLFLIWTSIYFYFSGTRGRKILFGVLLVLLATALVNYFAFDIKPEFYYTDLSFDGALTVSRYTVTLNILAAIICIAIVAFLWVKKPELLRNLTVVIAAALVILAGFQVVQITKSLEEAKTQEQASVENTGETFSSLFRLSKTEKNVVILMLDRAVGALVPYIFDEFPEFNVSYDGFTYYPNTISYAIRTLVGAPPLYGGYEYTPKALAEGYSITGADEEEKKAEGFRVLPVLFSQHGFDTTVCDPALFDISLYDDYPDINAYKLEGRFSDKYNSLFHTSVVPRQMRNFLVFSIYKTAPVYLRDYIYDNGCYMQAKNTELGYTQAFIDSYSTLVEYPNLTSAVDSDRGSFLFLQNCTTHEPAALDAPEYEVTAARNAYNAVYGDRTVNGRTMKMDNLSSWKTYCANVVALRELTKWFEAMKEMGVYDNTRIIVVADHGGAHGQFDEFVFPGGFDVESVNPLLMVKDFNAHGSMKTSDEFMTNADVATLATEGVIENPINPFTGKLISSEDKVSDRQYVERGVKKYRKPEEEKLRVDEIIWYTVHDSIFDKNNWDRIE